MGFLNNQFLRGDICSKLVRSARCPEDGAACYGPKRLLGLRLVWRTWYTKTSSPLILNVTR
jgi:hypothetical protein